MGSKKKKKASAYIPTVEQFTGQIRAEADRGCVLVAQQHIDNTLECGLRIYFATHGLTDDETNKLLDPGGYAILGSFGARTKVSHAFGVIDRALYTSLEALRDVRNAFAHHPEVTVLTEKHATQVVAKFDESIRDAIVSGVEKTQKETAEEIDKLVQETYGPIAALAYRPRATRSTPRMQFEAAAYILHATRNEMFACL